VKCWIIKWLQILITLCKTHNDPCQSKHQLVPNLALVSVTGHSCTNNRRRSRQCKPTSVWWRSAQTCKCQLCECQLQLAQHLCVTGRHLLLCFFRPWDFTARIAFFRFQSNTLKKAVSSNCLFRGSETDGKARRMALEYRLGHPLE
jgi:hypothetical protein